MRFHQIACRLYGRPLLILPSTAQTIESFVRTRMRENDVEAGRGAGSSTESGAQSFEVFQQTPRANGTVEVHGARASRFAGQTSLDASGRPLPFRRTTDGTAIITIVGELVNRGAWIGASSGLVSYEGITHQLAAATADPMTRVILLDCESPGGEAVGAFECAAAVRKAAAVKPVIAIVNGMACSAMYAIASGATRIVTTPTGLSGSIGVVMMHLDYSELLADAGVKPTFIFAGDHKVDGNPYEPLPNDVKAEFKREIDAFYGLFLQTVAAGRGARLTEAGARATQARVLMGEAAVAAGLADQVMTFDEALAAVADPAFTRRGAPPAPPTAQNQGKSMSTEPTNVPAATASTSIAATADAAARASAAAARLGFNTTVSAPTSVANLKAEALRSAALSLAKRRGAQPASVETASPPAESPIVAAARAERERLLARRRRR
ncbi:S49 family peptidase [Bosea sp. RCC_152_1]|uniref:S49 family peptidase n=1 Tax=Bosea sp. RCC_152_1 TaxID=3239228 RepID=UPI0035263276